jgi:hypothetical protein
MLARDGGPSDALIQTGRVIVHDHREQALLLQGKAFKCGRARLSAGIATGNIEQKT